MEGDQKEGVTQIKLLAKRQKRQEAKNRSDLERYWYTQGNFKKRKYISCQAKRWFKN